MKSKTNKNVKKYTSVELFAGAGGLALGLELAGFRNVACVEIDKTCCDTLKSNRPSLNVICDDIGITSDE